MSPPRSSRMRVVETRTQPLVPSSVMGMLIFVFTEMMLFAGLISAFLIVRSSALVWPPPGQPRLPLEETALNTAALLASGACLLLARRRFQQSRRRARAPLLASMLLGAFFVGFQGVEWVAMIGQGLTLTSSTLGSFFYLIVGMHAVHATAEVFWYFVVGLWPFLYLVVYP